jgi:FSR family fosmidomycin resistance protein-like MFS transporter
MIGFWPIYKTMMNLDLAIAGMISAGCAVAGEGLQLLFGALSDRGYRQRLIAVGIVLTTSSTLLAYTQDYRLLILLFFLTCLGSGAFHPSAAGLMGSISPHRKGFFITLFASGGALGLGLSQIIFSHSFYSLNGHTVLMAFPILAVGCWIYLMRMADQKAVSSSKRKLFDLKTLKAFYQRADLSSLYISQVCNQSLVWGLIFLLPDVLNGRGYDSWISLGGGHLFFILGGAAMMVPAGYLADRYSSKQVIFAATIIGFVLFYVFLYFPFLPSFMLLSLLFLLGAALGIVNPVSVALGNRLAADNPGLVSAFLMGMVWCVSEVIGQAGGGLLSKLFVDDAPAKALAILGASFIVGIFAVRRLPEEKSSQAQQTETI